MAVQPTMTVHPLDFDKLSGREFERLVFAFLWRRCGWHTLDWYGQLGSDEGRDIWGVREDRWGRDETVAIACANRRRVTAAKVLSDIDKIVAGPRGLPHRVIVVVGGPIPATLKTKAETRALGAGIRNTELWSGAEFEERLRFHAESVVRRFYGGEPYPDEAKDLKLAVAETVPAREETLGLIGRLFDRPAFTTRFSGESSLPAFRQAISDTIEALNTGIYRTRDGTVIGRIPTRHDFQAEEVRAGLDAAVRELVALRVAFDTHLRGGAIRACGCGDPDCPTFFMSGEVAAEMDGMRRRVLAAVGRLGPRCTISTGY